MDETRIDPRSMINGILRICCADDRNLQTLKPFSSEHKHGMIKRQCRVCGRGHYELIADPGRFGVVGGRL